MRGTGAPGRRGEVGKRAFVEGEVEGVVAGVVAGVHEFVVHFFVEAGYTGPT